MSNQRDWNIKLLGAEDVGLFQTIRLEALRVEPASFASALEDWIAMPDEEWRRRLLANPTFVALSHSGSVAIMGLMRQVSSKAAHRANLIMVYVTPKMRGSGLAVEMLNSVIEHAITLGIRQIELAASMENTVAIKFYLRHGFVEMGRVANGIFHDGRMVDDILMVKHL
jgi:GNAT superfamily N-acetyltransferase